MSAPTYEERLVAGLTALGYPEAKSSSSKFRAFKRVDGRFYFVGRAGALRVGRVVSDSYSVGDPGNQTGLYSTALLAGDRALGNVKPDSKQLLNSLLGGQT